MTDLSIRWSESTTGTFHLHDGRIERSLCGGVRSVAPARVTNNWRAKELIAGDGVNDADVNDDLCRRCSDIAKARHYDDWMALLGMCDEWEFKHDRSA